MRSAGGPLTEGDRRGSGRGGAAAGRAASGAEWRRPITRMAEGITVFALMIGAPMIIIMKPIPSKSREIMRGSSLVAVDP